jgi:DNA-binding Lrp family transcriptional regulator
MDTTSSIERTDRVLLNLWQRDLPLVPRPYRTLGERHGLDERAVIDVLARGLASGAVSRVGAAFGAGAGGAALLAALRVPAVRLEEVARIVDAEPAVSHDYAREHAWSLWFVVTGADQATVDATIRRIEDATGLRALRLPMRRAYRIDLGFDLSRRGRGGATQRPLHAATPIAPALTPLAARLERGLELVERPYEALGAPLGIDERAVLATLSSWCTDGTVRRFGAILRHHEFGVAANAMTVFALPESAVDDAGARLAAQPGVTLCYRRATTSGWPYNLYAMVHGRERGFVRRRIDEMTRAAGLDGAPREILFSTRRFKQTGSRYFTGATA